MSQFRSTTNPKIGMKTPMRLERQLHSLRPSPPKQSWSSIAESIEASLDQPDGRVKTSKPTNSSLATSGLVIRVTAAIGCSAWRGMLMLTLHARQIRLARSIGDSTSPVKASSTDRAC